MVPDKQKPLYDTSRAVAVDLFAIPGVIEGLAEIVRNEQRRTIMDEMEHAKTMIALRDIYLD